MALKIYVDFALPPDARERLVSGCAGHQLLFPAKPASSVLDKPEPDAAFFEADVAFGQPEPEAIARAAGLKWIHISSSGITRYDTEAFRARMAARQLPVTNSASVYNEACAEHLLSFLLAQSRRLPQCLASRAPNGSERWLALRRGSVSLKGQRAVILGFGAIGRRLAELLAPFRMELIAFRRRPRGDEGMPVVDLAGLPGALAKADHVLNILPDSTLTRRFFDAARFDQCRPGSVFCNIGRGTTIDQEALADRLESGHLREAWLDVTDPEPLPAEHRLLHLPNCFITPHTAGGHRGEVTTCVNHFLANLERFAAGRPLLDRVM